MRNKHQNSEGGMAIPTVGYPQNNIPRSSHGLPKSQDVIIFILKDRKPPPAKSGWKPFSLDLVAHL